MAESNEQPPVCPCGFWGSKQTLGLCSVCYKRHLQQNKEHETDTLVVPSSTTATDSCQVQVSTVPTTVTTQEEPSTEMQPQPATVHGAPANVDTASRDSTADSDSSTAGCAGSRDGSPSRQVQKNKKRCFVCKTRLELAFLEIGRCKCGYTFCELHRLPEQHACTYDHKESGRQEAREKMISPKKHVGTSLRRLDSDT